MELKECSKTPECKIQTPENHPKEIIYNLFALSLTFSTCNSDTVQWRDPGKCHIGLAMRKTGNSRYIQTRLSVCPWALLIFIAHAIF